MGYIHIYSWILLSIFGKYTIHVHIGLSGNDKELLEELQSHSIPALVERIGCYF